MIGYGIFPYSTRDEALALLMAVMLAPITKLARTLNEVPGKLVRTVAAIRDQKETGGGDTQSGDVPASAER